MGPQSGTTSILQSPKRGLKGHGCSLHLQNQDREPKFGAWLYQRPLTIPKSISRYRANSWNIGVLNTNDHIQIKIKMPNPSQEPPASFKAPTQDLKDMYVLCTFKIKIERQNFGNGCIRD